MSRLTHGFMKYKCENCNKEWNMWLEKGIEDKKDYEKTKVWKPSPFVIECPYCKCFAKDVSGYVPITSYRPLFDHMSRFENQAESDCGVPVVIIKDKECAE